MKMIQKFKENKHFQFAMRVIRNLLVKIEEMYRIVMYKMKIHGNTEDEVHEMEFEAQDAYERMMFEEYGIDSMRGIIKDDSMVKEVLREKRERHSWSIKNDNITIVFNSHCREVSVAKITEMDRPKTFEIITDGAKMGIISSVKYGSRKIKITCPHVMLEMTLGELDEYEMINPMVYCTKRQVKYNVYTYINPKSEAYFTAVDSDTEKYYWVKLKPIMYLNVPIKAKNKYKLTTIGIIIQFVCPYNLILSGTVIMIEKSLFVVSSTSTADDTQLKTLFAWLVVDHNITSTIKW